MKAEALFDLSGQTVVVTGAAGGLGLGIAEVVAANGADVVMADIDRSRLDVSVEKLQAMGARVEAAVVDVCNQDQVERFLNNVAVRRGRLDCVFANAGVTGGPGFGKPEGELAHASMDLWQACLDANLTGAFATMRAAAPHMKRWRAGSIVVTSSVAAIKASALPSYGYHASKAAIAQVVRVAALELAPFNVRVNAIAPGPFKTNIANGRMLTPEGAELFEPTVPLGRLAEVDEIKGVALLLASRASSYITGAIIPVDGGTQA
jgi:NAD(P)-dependent dehydrogenase (short-subunit alcohol dehydrogenase family)